MFCCVLGLRMGLRRNCTQYDIVMMKALADRIGIERIMDHVLKVTGIQPLKN